MSFFFFSSTRRHTRSLCDWSSDVCSSRLSFFLQAEDGIRDHCVTGVQTCALPIYEVVVGRLGVYGPGAHDFLGNAESTDDDFVAATVLSNGHPLIMRFDGTLPRIAPRQIGRASCRERG